MWAAQRLIRHGQAWHGQIAEQVSNVPEDVRQGANLRQEAAEGLAAVHVPLRDE